MFVWRPSQQAIAHGRTGIQPRGNSWTDREGRRQPSAQPFSLERL